MALGTCKVCELLVTIRQVPDPLNPRRPDWTPIEHEGPDGRRCPGAGKLITR